MFVWEHIYLGGFRMDTVCHMIFHCQTRLAITMTMLFNHGICHVGFWTKACHGIGRPQTWKQNIYVCVGTSLIGWFDDGHTLPHDFSVIDTSSKYYDHAIQPWDFPCYKGVPWVWKASNMGTKHICLCGSIFIWVGSGWTQFATWFFTARHV